jgi:hypothetical protein
MGLFDFFTSTRKPASGTPVLSPEEVRARLAALDRPTAPWHVRPAQADEKADFVAEWKIVDARWYEVFAKASLSKAFRIELTLDPAKHEVKALDRELTIEWTAGVPKTAFAVKAFRGQEQSIEFGKAVAFTEELRPGVVYDYRFSTKEIKEPLQQAVTAAGWTYRGVVL